MDIKVEKGQALGYNPKENYVAEFLSKYFDNYPFVESIKVFFRGEKHPYKKVKLQARLKGKDVFVEAKGDRHEIALEEASKKLRVIVEKYKTKHYKRA